MRILAPVLCALTLVAGCGRAPEPVREARRNFDALVGAECPKESRLAVARRLGAKADEIRVFHYGPTGRPDATNYFAAMSRDGKVLVGVIDEAWAKITKEHYETTLQGEDFVWAVKCLRNDTPFGDRTYRYKTALPVKIWRGPKYVGVQFVDGWLPVEQNWSTGTVKINLAGTALLDEEHSVGFAFRPAL